MREMKSRGTAYRRLWVSWHRGLEARRMANSLSAPLRGGKVIRGRVERDSAPPLPFDHFEW
jgi:hypothetical protein